MGEMRRAVGKTAQTLFNQIQKERRNLFHVFATRLHQFLQVNRFPIRPDPCSRRKHAAAAQLPFFQSKKRKYRDERYEKKRNFENYHTTPPLLHREPLEARDLDLLTEFLHGRVDHLAHRNTRIFDERLLKQDALGKKAVELALKCFFTRAFGNALNLLRKNLARSFQIV